MGLILKLNESSMILADDATARETCLLVLLTTGIKGSSDELEKSIMKCDKGKLVRSSLRTLGPMSLEHSRVG